jgi:hypothetical protein
MSKKAVPLVISMSTRVNHPLQSVKYETRTPNSELLTRRDVGANPLGRTPNSELRTPNS